MPLGSDLTEKSSVEYEKLTLTINVDGKEKVDIDLLSSFQVLRIYEDIFEKLLSGTLTFRDVDRFFDSEPLIGGEILELRVTNKYNDEKITLKFEVYGANYITGRTSASQLVTIYFLEEGYKAFSKEYSTSFDTNTTRPSKFISDFSKNVLGKTIDDLERSEKYEEEESIAFPYQKFHYMLTYLNQYMVSENGYHFYLYYSDLYKKHYKTLSKMVDDGIQNVFAEVTPNVLSSDPSNFIEYKELSNINLVEASLNRGLGSTQRRWDSENKDIVTNKFTYTETMNTEKTLGNYNLFETSLDDASLSNYYASSNNFKSQLSILKHLYENSISYLIEFEGMLDRSCGSLAYIVFQDYLNPENPNNSAKTGLYLMKSIVHNFYPGAYRQNINLIRNGHLIKISSDQGNAANPEIAD